MVTCNSKDLFVNINRVGIVKPNHLCCSRFILQCVEN